jgi:hypothetical protein
VNEKNGKSATVNPHVRTAVKINLNDCIGGTYTVRTLPLNASPNESMVRRLIQVTCFEARLRAGAKRETADDNMVVLFLVYFQLQLL